MVSDSQYSQFSHSNLINDAVGKAAQYETPSGPMEFSPRHRIVHEQARGTFKLGNKSQPQSGFRLF